MNPKRDYRRICMSEVWMMPEPIMMSELPKVKLDLRGIREYAKSKGVAIADLSEEEKRIYMKK